VSQQKRKLEEVLGLAWPMLRSAKKAGLQIHSYKLIRLPKLIGVAE
jgi:hypothetical protein